MARQKKWNSEAEKQAAYRARKVDPDEDPLDPGEREFLAANVQRGTASVKLRLPDGTDIVPVRSGLPPLPEPVNPPDLELYVADAVRAARIAAEGRKYGPDTKEFDRDEWIESAVRSAERYARWRHAGYLAREITSL